MAWPDAATLLVVFILYTNAAVVAVEFHGLPFIVGGSVPLLLIIPLTNYVIFRREEVIIDRLLPLIFLFLLVQTVGAFFAKQPDTALRSLLTSATEGLGLYFIFTNVIRTPGTLRRVVWALIMAAVFLGALSSYQWITQTYENNYGGFAQLDESSLDIRNRTGAGELRQPRLCGPTGDQNFHAQSMLTVLVLALFRVWGERSGTLRALAAAAAVLIALGIALTLSRGAAVGLVAVLIVMSFMRYVTVAQFGLVVLGIAILLQLVPQTRLKSLRGLWGTIDTRGAGIGAVEESTQSRITEMITAALVFADNPIIGVGPGMFKQHYDDYVGPMAYHVKTGTRAAHNLYLEIAAEHGTMGLIIFLAIIFAMLRRLVRARSSNNGSESASMATAFILALVAYLTTGLFLSFAYVRYFWLVMALAAAASRHTYPDLAPEERRL